LLRSKLNLIDEVLPFALVIVCVALARFIKSELIVFFVFIGTLVVFVWRRYDAELLIEVALILLLGCAILLISGAERYANDVAIWAYYFLVIGVLGRLITDLIYKSSLSYGI